jgi:hypothetical protein
MQRNTIIQRLGSVGIVHVGIETPCFLPVLSSPSSSLHRRHTENLAPLLLLELLPHDAVDSSSDGIAGFVDEDTSIVIKLDHTAVPSTDPVSRPNHNGVSNVTALDLVRVRGRAHAFVGGTSVLLNHHHDTVA